MVGALASIVAITVALAGSPATETRGPTDVSLGTGWTVAQVRASLDGAPGPAAAPREALDPEARHAAAQPKPDPRVAPSARPPRPVDVRPFAHHSDLDARIKEARRAQAMRIGAALAVQAAMIVYGITRAIDNAKVAEIARDEPPASQFKPMHPR